MFKDFNNPLAKRFIPIKEINMSMATEQRPKNDLFFRKKEHPRVLMLIIEDVRKLNKKMMDIKKTKLCN